MNTWKLSVNERFPVKMPAPSCAAHESSRMLCLWALHMNRILSHDSATCANCDFVCVRACVCV